MTDFRMEGKKITETKIYETLIFDYNQYKVGLEKTLFLNFALLSRINLEYESTSPFSRDGRPFHRNRHWYSLLYEYNKD